MLVGFGAMIEMVYHLQLGSGGSSSTLRLLGLTLDSRGAASWLGALAVAAAGFAAFEFVRRRFAIEWGHIQTEIEVDMTFKEPSPTATAASS